MGTIITCGTIILPKIELIGKGGLIVAYTECLAERVCKRESQPLRKALGRARLQRIVIVADAVAAQCCVRGAAESLEQSDAGRSSARRRHIQSLRVGQLPAQSAHISDIHSQIASN